MMETGGTMKMNMKTIFKSLRIAALLLCAAMMVAGCSNVLDAGNGEKTESRAVIPDDTRDTNITVYVLNAPTDGGDLCNVWAWIDDKNAYNSQGWPGADMRMSKETVSGKSAWKYTFKVNADEDLKILFNKGGDAYKTDDITVAKGKLVADAELYFVWGSTEVYGSADECVGIMSASITSADGKTISVTVSLLDRIDTEKLSVKDSKGNSLTISNVSEVSNGKATITLSSGNITNIPYKISYSGGKEILATITSDIIETRFAKAAVAQAGNFGVTVNGGKATFRTWAPIAESVEVLLYESATKAGVSPATYEGTGATKTDLGTPSGTPIPMTFDANTGVWSAENVDFGSNKYYKYKIKNSGTTYYVCDIWAKAANADSYAAQIVDINESADAKPANWETAYTNPFGNSGSETKDYTDAVIYEMHIRDWSRAFEASKSSTGKFQDITNALGTNGGGEFAKHLKDLGVTHVQILSMFDYAQTVENTDYNWGYNPYHYNVPEGRYVNYGDAKDGTDAVCQMREMIKAFHDAGIAVNMDVVYNHTNGTGEGSLYDSTVPQYFYRMNSSGGYSNASGCGNEVATNHAMVRKYVIESLKHWMEDYHINGFRFDLMGVHETTTMKEIYEELYKIDPNVMVYGEPWKSGDSPMEKTTCKPVIDDCAAGTSVNGVACFNDDIRDATKGAEYPKFWRGHVQGLYNDGGIVTGLLGSVKSAGGFTDRIGRSINYAECHDNYTLYDKLTFSALGIKNDSEHNFSSQFKEFAAGSKELELIKEQDTLVAAYIILSQGVPFLNGGQEFLRTKKGNPDSYAPITGEEKKGGKNWSAAEIDECNTIDLKRKDTYSDVYKTYKGLLALRRDNSVFKRNPVAKAETLASGITKYTTGDFCVYFNASDKDFSLAMNSSGAMSLIHHPSAPSSGVDGYSKSVDVSIGVPTESTTLPTGVSAHSFVILKK